MAEQILSQEEIDALLTAMDRGEVDVEQDIKKEKVVEPCNLTSPNSMLGSQFYALEEVYDKFATLLNQSLSSTLQRPIEVEFVSTEMVKYGEFISAFSTPTSLNIFSMEPLIGSALMAMEAKLVFSLIDCMLGGDGKPTAQVRDFTLIEQRMIKKVAEELLQIYQEAWAVVHTVNITLRKTETKPEFVHLATPNDLMIIMVFAIKGHKFSGNIHLCLSYLMLEPIKEKLSSTYVSGEDTEHAWQHQLENLLKETHVNVIAELGKTQKTIRELLELEVDHILRLNTGPKDPVVLTVDGIPKFRGLPGVIKGNRAVEITSQMRPNRGEK